MDTLTRAMRDTADEAPDALAVATEQWVGDSWHAGRRRRLLRRVASSAGLVAAAAVVVSLVAAGVGGMPSASVPADGSSRSEGVSATSYPQQIGHQWWVRDLPSAPGPVAAVVRIGGLPGFGDQGRWEVVDQRGTRFSLPHHPGPTDITPFLSGDGRLLAYLTGPEGPLVVHDLVSGRLLEVPGLGGDAATGGSQRADRAVLSAQSPGYFSTSGRLLALSVEHDGGWTSATVVLDVESGVLVPVERLSRPAGWLAGDRLVGRAPEKVDEAANVSPAEESVPVVVWDLATRTTSPLTTVALPVVDGLSMITRDQFWGQVRGDGHLWLSLGAAPSGGGGVTRWLLAHELPSGRPVDAGPDALGGHAGYDLGNSAPFFDQWWRHDVPLEELGDSFDIWGYRPAVGGNTTVKMEFGSEFTRVLWATNALDGTPSWSPVGASASPWSFWWREIALAGLVALGLLAWRGRASRQRLRRSAGAQA